MKNKKKIKLIVGIIMIMLVEYAVLTFLNGSFPSFGSKGEYAEKGVFDIKETSEKLPVFTIYLSGAYEGQITNTLIEDKNIKVYEFDAVVDNGWDLVKNHYVGVRLSDVFNAFDIKDFRGIKLTSSTETTVHFNSSELKSDMFIVVSRDGKKLDDNTWANLLTVDYEQRYSVIGLINMDFEFLNSVETAPSEGNNENNQ